MTKKICFILPGWVSKQTGGSEWQLYNLSEKFIEKGWKVEVVTVKKNIIYPGYLNKKIHYIYYKQVYFGLSRFLAFISLFIKLFRTDSHYYYVRTNARMERGTVKLFSKIKNIRYIFAVAHDDELKITSFRQQYNSRYFFKRLILYIDALIMDIFCFNIKNTDLTIVQTKFQQNYLQDNYKLNSIIINNSYFGSYLKDISHKKNWIVWINNMREFKRPQLYLSIVRKYPDSGFKFLMIGDARSYSSMINDVSESNFEYLGSKTYKEVQEFFIKARILINTSSKEGFSNTFLEAWANKVWIITLGVDPDNIISDYGFGNVCNDISEVFDHLKHIENNGLNEQKLGEAADFVKQNYNFDKNFDLLLNALRELG